MIAVVVASSLRIRSLNIGLSKISFSASVRFIFGESIVKISLTRSDKLWLFTDNRGTSSIDWTESTQSNFLISDVIVFIKLILSLVTILSLFVNVKIKKSFDE